MPFLQSISTRPFPPETRLERWNDHLRQRFDGVQIDGARELLATFVSCDLGDITLMLARTERCTVRRWHDRVPTAPEPRRLLYMQHSGSSLFSQGGRVVPLAVGDMTYCVPDQAYGHELSNNNGSLILDIPDTAMDLPAGRSCELLPGGGPATGLLHDFVISLLSQRWTQDIADDEKIALRETVIGLVRRCFQQRRAVSWTALPKDDSQRVLAFIETNLNDSSLRTGGIASALSLSVRAVQDIFAGMATTPSAYIIQRRLALASALLRARPDTSVMDMAYEFGFSDTAHFCRLFKRQYGVSPGRFAHNLCTEEQLPG